MSLTFVRLHLCHSCILKVTWDQFLVKAAALKGAAGVPTDDLTRVALICAAPLPAADDGWSGGDTGGGADGHMEKKSSDALWH